MFDTFFAVARKEMLQTSRDRALIRLLLVGQVVQLSVIGSMDTSPRNIPTAVVDQDHSSYSREFVSKLVATQAFDVRYAVPTPEQARVLIRSGRAKVAIIVPPDFHEKRARQSGASILVLTDGSDGVTTTQTTTTIDALVARENAASAVMGVDKEPVDAPPLSSRPLLLFNPEGRTANFYLPAVVAMTIQILMSFGASAVAKERQQGTLERVLMTPLSPTGFILGKLFPWLIFVFVNISVLLMAIRWVFRVPIRGDLGTLALAGFLYSFALLAVGISIGAAAKTREEASQRAQLLLIPPIFLSGYAWPRASLPLPLQWLGNVFPQTHFIELSRGIILRGASFSELIVHFLVLAAISISFTIIGVRTFVKHARS